MAQFSVIDFGATPDGKTLSTKAVQAAIDAAKAAGGGTVIVPTGQFVIGTVTLCSDLHLHLEAGAVLLGSSDPADYDQQAVAGEYAHAPSGVLLQALDAERITITGPGTIDQRGRLFMDGWRVMNGRSYEPYIRGPKAWRPRMISFFRCQQITLSNLTLRDAASWCLHLKVCDDVLVQGVRIRNDLAIPNCDGIDPDHCTRVRISDCDIEAGDDCIVLKATRVGQELGGRGTHDVTITNCTLCSTSAAIKIGTESHADFSRIVVSNCVIRDSSRGLAIQLRDSGNVEDVAFNNIIVQTRLFADCWWGQAEPVYVTAIPRNNETTVGRIRHVRFSNILARGENGVFIAGCPQSLIEDVVFNNCRFEVDKWSKWPAGFHDRRPMDGQEHGGLSPHPTNGLYVEHAHDIRLNNTTLHWGDNRQPQWGDDIETHHVTGFIRTGRP